MKSSRGELCGGRAGRLPVHGELSDQGDVRVVRSGLVLVVQEVQVGPVDSEALSSELVTQVVLVQLGQLLLELKGRRGAWERESQPRGPGACPVPCPPQSLSLMDAAEGQTQKDKVAVFISLCNLL